ncbi:MAG: hypothetical protein K9L30_16535 [Desulfobacterales bacterium]|nr:hypothetical protein [Desulfobacterales bacterium]
MKLNHCANRITKGNIQLVQKLFVEELKFRLLRGLPEEIWLRQGNANVDIQFCESDANASSDNDKQNSHIAFTSDKPEEELEKLSAWFKNRGFETTIGSWSDKEFYLDVPEVFLDFSIEVMYPDIADYDM